MSAISYDHLPMEWVGNWVDSWARRCPAREAVLDSGSGERFSYGDLGRRAERTGTWLLDELALAPGDPVCLISRNRIEALDLYLACGKAGLVLAPLSFRLRARELNDLLARIRPRVLIHEACFQPLVDTLEVPDSVRSTVCMTDGAGGLEQMLRTISPRDINRPNAMSEPFLYIHTGGTTATPKVCVVPFRQMIWNSFDLMVVGGGTNDSRELITFPFFHIGGWNSLTPILHGGGFAVLMREFDAGEVLRLVDAEQIRHFGGVEAMFRFILEHPDFPRSGLTSLERITSAGAPCAEPVMRSFIDRGIAITQAYGQTEAGPSNFIHGGGDNDLESLWQHNRTVGTSMPHCDYRIVNQETGEALPPESVGELWMRSPHNFDGYLDDPDRTRSVVTDGGWIRSGDLALEDGEGYVRIVGRVDNMFISGGENVSPEEIEAVLLAHPDVAQAGVVALSDRRWGHVPGAAVVPAAPSAGDALAEVLRGYCRESLAGFRQPRELRLVSELPVTGAGKLDRAALRELFHSPANREGGNDG